METAHELRIPIRGLGCGGAGATDVERALAAVPGVRSAYVNPANETAYIRTDQDLVDSWALLRVIHRAGYHAGRPVES